MAPVLWFSTAYCIIQSCVRVVVVRVEVLSHVVAAQAAGVVRVSTVLCGYRRPHPINCY